MSWTQGVLPREEMSPRVIEALERGYEIETGETAKVEWKSWHRPDGSGAAAYFDSHRMFNIGKRK